MSDATFENVFEETFLNKVSSMSPEDAMNVLKQKIVENWYRENAAWPEGDIMPWDKANEAIELLEQSPEPETLAKLGADPSEGLTSRAIAQLWDKLDENQQKRVLRSIKRGIALYGLEDFFNALLNTFHTLLSLRKEGSDVLVKQILKKAYEFIDGKISFDDLLNSIAGLLAQYYPDIDTSGLSKPFTEAKTLSYYVNRRDLQKLVTKLFSLSSLS